jgi:predicted Zn-dependent protease
MLLSEDDARTICRKVLGYVRAKDAEVMLTSEDHGHVRFAANSFTTSGRRADTTVSATVWIDARKGAASTNELDDSSLRAMVAEAERIARVSPVDREYVPTLGPQEYKPGGGYEQATVDLAPAARAKAVAGVIEECGKNKERGAGFHQTQGRCEAGTTKNGNFYYWRSSLASLSVTARTAEGGGSGYFLRNHYADARLEVARIAREAVRKALDSREPRTLDAGAYTVILEPQAVADLLSVLRFAFDARTADEGRSAFSAPAGKNRVGEKIFDERISILSDPWSEEVSAPPVAQDGIPAQRMHLVRNGVLENLVYSRFWARKNDKKPTPGPVNIILMSPAPAAGVEEMVRETSRGLLVSRFWYIRMVDPRRILLTGLSRDGVWYIENGKVQYPVRNFRFNQSIVEMLAPGNVDLIGASERVSNSESQGESVFLLPALKLKQFHFTSQSEAV